MIKKIDFIHYRKLKDISLSFSSGINAIAGTNGTCKSSLLYIIGNSFQSVGARNERLRNHSCMKIISALNNSINPKIESLVRDSKRYTNPANDTVGSLYSVEYFTGQRVSFRKHNSERDFRFALKPYYKRGAHESLPSCPVIYLGISRLLPFGESSDELSISKIKQKLPPEYQTLLSNLYKNFTHYNIDFDQPVAVENFKKRSEFSTDVDGVDSNTISAGEDNLSIILTALVSLRFYYEMLVSSDNDVESILLVDELDATLHPTFQKKLLNYIKEYSKEYKIQVFFTTHNFNLLEYTIKNKNNVIYLIDNRTSVFPLANPDWPKIKMHLEGINESEVFADSKIPVLLEDDEARWMFEHILSFWQNQNPSFGWIKNHLHMVKIKAGSEVLRGLFSDETLNTKTIGWICILDGDKNGDLSKCITTLPGDKPVEELLYKYASDMYDSDDQFWTGPSCIAHGFSKQYFLDTIQEQHQAIENDIALRVSNGISTHGLRREKNKAFFNNNESFFKDVFYHWLNDPNNQLEIKKFYSNLETLYKKVCSSAGLVSDYWPSNNDANNRDC